VYDQCLIYKYCLLYRTVQELLDQHFGNAAPWRVEVSPGAEQMATHEVRGGHLQFHIYSVHRLPDIINSCMHTWFCLFVF
jgi:hypothetical protein